MKKTLLFLIIAVYGTVIYAQTGISDVNFTPQSTLHVHKNSAGQLFQLSNVNTTNGNTPTVTSGFNISIDASKHITLNQYENANMYFRTNNTDRMTILSGGNVGIGTTTPAYKLSILAPSVANGTGHLQLTTPGSAQGERSALTLYSTFQGTGDNGPRRTADIIAGFQGGAWGYEYLSLNVGNNGNANDGAVITSEKMRILSNGNVGIGTTTPGYILDVNGVIRANNEIISILGGSGQFRAISGNYGAFIRNDGADTYIPLLTASGDQYGSWNSLRPLRVNNASGDVYLANSAIVAQHSTGYLGVGTAPSQRLHVAGNIQFSGALMPNGIAGTSGQILISQGAGVPPIWQTPSSIPMYGNNMQSIKLTTYATNTDVNNWTTLLTINVTPVHSTVYIFSSLGTRLEDNSGYAQFGQAIVKARILVNGVEVARNASVVTDFDEDYYGNDNIVTSGGVSFTGIPVSVTVGNSTTITLQWMPSVLWATSPWRLGIDPSTGTVGDHAVLTVFD
jgi:hypothetical protein